MGALAAWADSEAVLPAYMIGMVLAGTVGKDHVLVRRLRTLTFGAADAVLFHFAQVRSYPSGTHSRTGDLSHPAGRQSGEQMLGVYPTTKAFRYEYRQAVYTTLLMSTGLTFGTISALFGLTHNVITQSQYSYLVAAVVACAVIPTLIANAFFIPHDLLPKRTGVTIPVTAAADGREVMVTARAAGEPVPSEA
jgi:Kef-type K+ transport system membrane component KefB